MIFELTKCILDFEVSKLLDEKIKINVSISLREILLYDAVAFGIVKKSGVGNINGLRREGSRKLQPQGCPERLR